MKASNVCGKRSVVSLGFGVLTLFAAHLSMAAAYVVSTGETVSVDDSNVAEYAGGFSFVDGTGKIVFSTTSAPTMEISGAGTVVKSGNAAWTMTRALSGFTGEYRIEGGSVRPENGELSASYYGNPDVSVLTIAQGATAFVHPLNEAAGVGSLGSRVVHIAGTGLNGQGAVCVDRDVASYPFSRMILDGDAQLSFPATGYAETRFARNAVLDMGGHVLTKTGYGALYVSGVVTNMGQFVCADAAVAGGNDLNTICFYENVSFYPIEGKTLAECPLTLGNTSCLMFNWCTTPIPLPLNVAANASAQIRPSSSCPLADSNCCAIAGAVSVGAGATLYLTTYGTSDRHVYFTGTVGGAGRIVPLGSDGGRYYFLGQNLMTSDYTFSMSSALSAGTTFSSLTLGTPQSLPQGATMTISGGWVCLRLVDAGGEGWTASEIGNYLRTGSFGSTPQMIAFDLSNRDDAIVDAADLGDLSSFAQGLGLWGPGKTLTLTGSLSMPQASLGTYAGTLRVSGPGASVVKNLCVGGYDSSVTGVVEIADGAEVEASATFDLGCRANAVGIVRVENASFTNTSTERVNLGTRSGAVGILDVRQGASVNMRVLPAADASCRCGAIYVAGGTFYSPGDVYIGHLSHGYLEVAGGAFTAAAGLNLSNGGWSDAIVRMSSGRIDIPAGHSFVGGSGGNNVAHLCLSGGVLENGPGEIQFPGNTSGANTLAVLTLENQAEMIVTNGDGKVVFCAQNDSTGICNLNGGTLSLKNNLSAIDPQWRPGSRGFLNLSGGTIRTVASIGALFDGWERITVYPGGITVDTAGNDVWQGSKPLLKPEGGGVLSVPWTVEGGYVSTPQVKIEGDGAGASAVAEFDRMSGCVTAIRVLSPGNGYSWARARVWEGRTDTTCLHDHQIDCQVGEIPTTGGFVKKGAGQFSLMAENTYGGDTVLAGGKLKVESTAAAIPAGSRIVLAGGTLDMSGFPIPLKWAVDCTAPTARYDGVLTFPEGSDLELRNFDPEGDADLVLVDANEIVGRPSADLDDPRWRLRVTKTQIKLCKRRGLSVIIR